MKSTFLLSIITSFCFTTFLVFGQPGNADASFITNCGSGTNGVIYNLAIQSDGKIILGGNFTNYNAFADGNIDRILPSGGIDGNFVVGTGCNSWVNAITVLSDGKIAVAGDFSTIQGAVREKLALLNPDGTLFSGFNSSGTDYWINDIIELSSNKIMVGGDFSTLQGFPALFLGILYNDGSFDIGNNIGTGPNNIIRGITKTNDRAIIFGDFTSYDGNSIQNCAKIYLDGTFDPTFSPGLGFNNVIYDVQIQSDGKLIAGGAFTSYDGFSSQRITRMNSNGTFDLTFNIGAGFDNFVKSIAIQSDGKIVVVGNFTSFNGVLRNKIARLNSDGSLDLNFNPGSGFNGIPYDVKIDSDGNILVVGEFTEYNSTLVGHLVKLNGSAVLLDEFEKIETSHLYPNPCSTNFSINTSDYIKEVNIYNSLGQLIYSGKSSSIDLKEPEAGIYFVRIKTNKNLWTEKLEVN